MRVSWNAVIGAKGYLVQYSSDSNFVNDTNAVIVDAPATSITLSGLRADTMYHIKVKSLADIGDSDSNFSMAYLARTGIATGDESVTHLQNWLAEMQSVFQNFATLLPELESTVLTTLERKRLLGSGVRRYGFIDKVSDVASDNMQFWPASANLQDALKDQLRKIEALRNVLVWLRTVNRVAGDMLLLTGHEAFQMANTYYASVRAAARSNILGARQVFQLLQMFWQRPRNPSAEPTKKQAMRDARALDRGTRVGKVTFENEADTLTKGKKSITDETTPVPKGGVKITERLSAEFDDLNEELSAVD